MQLVVLGGVFVVVLVLLDKLRGEPGTGHVWVAGDYRKLEYLYNIKSKMGFELEVCISQEKAKGLSVADFYATTLAYATALFVSAYTLNPQKGISAMRKVVEAYQAIKSNWPKGAPCQWALGQLQASLAANDRASAELGLDPNLSADDIKKILDWHIGKFGDPEHVHLAVSTPTLTAGVAAGTIGGTTWGAGTHPMKLELDIWDAGIRDVGLAAMLRRYQQERKPAPAYSLTSTPKGLAIR